MDWYGVMIEEHMVILRAVEALKIYSGKLASGKDVPKDILDGILDVLMNFADRCHHAKEETVLFPLLLKKGPQHREMVDSLLSEHAQGRGFVRGMRSGSRDEAIKNAQEYAALLPRHIAKENRYFKEADGSFSADERRFLFEEFGRIEREIIGEGRHGEYLDKIKDIRNRLDAA